MKGVMKRRQTGLSHSLVVRDDKEMAVVEMIVGSAVTVIAVEEIARIAIEIGGRMKTAIGGHQRKRGHHQVRGQSRQRPEVEVVMTMMTMTAVTEVIIAAINTYETLSEEEEVPSSAGALGRARGRGRGQAPSETSRSTVKTSEIRGLLQEQAKKQQSDRLKPSLSQVRIETFKGSRSHYRDWKRTLEAQRALYRLEDHELALLIYLSCEGEPRQILNQLEMEEIQEPGGLGRVLKLLEDSYGSRSDERFEEKQEAYLSYRRAPGTSVAAYIATLKRLRQEYLKEDEGTTISDRSFAQRLFEPGEPHSSGKDGYLLLGRR